MRYELITTLPQSVELQLTPYAAEELRISRESGLRIVEDSTEARVYYRGEAPLVAAGVHRPALLGPGIFWFLLCNEFTPPAARSLLPEFRQIFYRFPVLQTGIEHSWRSGCRFAEFFGFRRNGVEFDMFGRHYAMYEARR